MYTVPTGKATLNRFNRGLATAKSKLTLEEGYVADCSDVYFLPGGGVTKRKGFTAVVSAGNELPSKITHLYDYAQRDGTEEIVAFTETGNMYAYRPHTASFDELETGFTPNVRYESITYWATSSMSDVMIFTNGVDAVKKYDPVNGVSDLAGNPPKAKHIALYKNYLFLANTVDGVNKYPQNVVYSSFDSVEDWQTFNFFQAQDYSDSYITGLASTNDYLIVFKSESVWAITGYSPDTFAARKLSDVGCIAPGSIQTLPLSFGTGIIFLSRDGFYITDGVNVYPASEQLQHFEIASGMLDAIRSVYDADEEVYLIALPSDTASLINDIVYSYQPKLGAWSKHRMKVSAYAMQDGRRYHAHEGMLYEEKIGRLDDTVPVAAHVKTKIIAPQGEVVQKDFRRAYITFEIENKSDAEMNVRFISENGTRRAVAIPTSVFGQSNIFSSITNNTIIWGLSRFGDSVWGGDISGEAMRTIKLSERARYLQIDVSNTSEEGFTLIQISLDYKIIRRG